MVSRPDRVGGDPLTLVSVCQSQPLPRTAGQCGAVLPPRPAPPRRPARAWNATRTCPAELGTLHITLIPCHRHRRPERPSTYTQPGMCAATSRAERGAHLSCVVGSIGQVQRALAIGHRIRVRQKGVGPAEREAGRMDGHRGASELAAQP